MFFGGGTPTLLAPGQLGGLLRVIDGEFGLAAGAEVTVEANPETITPQVLAQLRAEGITRISFGMQSAEPRVLAVLDRVHQPGRPAQCARWAREAGFEHVSLDLIYGTPGETDDDWRASLDAALAAGPDHISAYALIVEDGTRLAARIRRGELPAPDDDAMADRYLIADEVLTAPGSELVRGVQLGRLPGRSLRAQPALLDRRRLVGRRARARTATSAVRAGGTSSTPRPTRAGSRPGSVPATRRETLTPAEQQLERIMLLTRLAGGCPVTELDAAGRDAAAKAAADGLADPAALATGQVILTLRGRLLADAVIRDLTG